MKGLDRKKWIIRIILTLFFGGIVYFFVKSFLTHWDTLSEKIFDISPFWFLLSVGIYLLWYLSLNLVWKYMLPREKNIWFWETYYIQSLAWMGRYIPAKVGMVLTKMYFLTNKWISKSQSFLLIFYEFFFQVISSFLVGIPFLVIIFWKNWNEWNTLVWSIGIATLCMLVIVHPTILRKSMTLALRAKEPDFDAKNIFLSLSDIVKYIGSYSLTHIGKWGSFAFLAMSVHSDMSVQIFLFCMLAWIVTTALGMIAIFTPNGLGVREGSLVLVLWIFLPVETALLLGAGSRVWAMLCDSMIALSVGGQYLYTKKLWKKIPS